MSCCLNTEQAFGRKKHKKRPNSPIMKQPKRTQNQCKIHKMKKKNNFFWKTITLHTITNLYAVLENIYGELSCSLKIIAKNNFSEPQPDSPSHLKLGCKSCLLDVSLLVGNIYLWLIDSVDKKKKKKSRTIWSISEFLWSTSFCKCVIFSVYVEQPYFNNAINKKKKKKNIG